MTQRMGFDADADARDITAGLPAGKYLAQPTSGSVAGVFYATAVTAPSDDEDYFVCQEFKFFEFTVDTDTPATWVKARHDGVRQVASVAIARL